MKRFYVFMALLMATLLVFAAGETIMYRGINVVTKAAKDTTKFAASTARFDSSDFFIGASNSAWSGFSSAGDASWTWVVWKSVLSGTGADGPDLQFVACAPGWIVGTAVGDTICGNPDIENTGTDLITTDIGFDEEDDKYTAYGVALGTLPRCDFIRVVWGWNDGAEDAGYFEHCLKGPKK